MRRWTETPVARQRSNLLSLGCLLVVASLAACSVPNAERGADPDDTIGEQGSTTVAVERQDLAKVERLDGLLGHESPLPVTVGRDGVLTWMPAGGMVIKRGEVVAEVDGMTTRLLYGERPAWRRLAVGEPAGPDIGQLNDNLAAMGYADREDLPEDQFDWRTREAIRDWQEDLGLKRLGTVEFGDVMFRPAEIRVGHPLAQIGSLVGTGQTLFEATGVEQVVQVDLDPASVGDVQPGLGVTVVMPDGTPIDGAVDSIGSVVSASELDGRPVVKVTIELTKPRSADEDSSAQTTDASQRFDAGPVTVLLERVLAEDVLVVPVGALLASNSGYSVELVTARGTRIVAVEPGEFADGLVEITGNVTQGDEVVVPS